MDRGNSNELESMQEEYVVPLAELRLISEAHQLGVDYKMCLASPKRFRKENYGLFKASFAIFLDEIDEITKEPFSRYNIDTIEAVSKVRVPYYNQYFAIFPDEEDIPIIEPVDKPVKRAFKKFMGYIVSS